MGVQNLMGVQNVADLVRRGRLRWFGHLERRSVDDWVSACRRARKITVIGNTDYIATQNNKTEIKH